MDDSIDFSALGLTTEPLCRAAIYVDAERSVGDLGVSPFGHRQVHYIRDGWFDGPKLKGKVLSGGGDWPQFGTDSHAVQRGDVRAVWKTEDGALIYLAYTGRIAAPPDVLAEMMASGPHAIDPKRYYFRMAPLFETADPRYAWLNRILAIGVGRAIEGGVAYQFHTVL
jgi:hypothetical protein